MTENERKKYLKPSQWKLAFTGNSLKTFPEKCWSLEFKEAAWRGAITIRWIVVGILGAILAIFF